MVRAIFNSNKTLGEIMIKRLSNIHKLSIQQSFEIIFQHKHKNCNKLKYVSKHKAIKYLEVSQL